MSLGRESSPQPHPAQPDILGQGGVPALGEEKMPDAAGPGPRGVPGWGAGLGAVVLGLVAGVVAVLWQSWATVLTAPRVIVLPWGALLGAVVVFCIAVAWGLKAARRWIPGVVGLCAFAVLAGGALSGQDTLVAPMDPRYFAVAPGAVWSAITVTVGTIVATLAALMVVARYVRPLPRRR